GDDLTARAELGFFPEPGQLEAERVRRAGDRAVLAAAFRGEGLLGDGVPEAPPVEAAYRYLARTPARLLMVQLEDALGLAEQVNVPSTPEAAPNWRRRLPVDLAAIFDAPAAQALFAALNRERPRAP